MDHPILKSGFEVLEDEASSQTEWRYMGIRLFRKKFYTSAATCFEKAGDQDLKHKCFAYFHADEAANLNSEAESLLFTAKHNKTLKRPERKGKRTEAKKLKNQAFEEY